MSESEIEQVRAAIAALEAQRDTLGDEVVETALVPLHEKLAALTQPTETPDERKRVTVLFADVSGYTAMSEQMDPEDVTAIMNRLFESLTEEITRYGGTIDKYSGDAVMALFGAPEALENHEELAVRAALDMQRAIADFNAGFEEQRDTLRALRLRIGLHTGEVLAGWVGSGEAKSYTVMGDAVNLASRLEHACPVGRVMISGETARPLHAIFDFEPPRQITVRGKSDPITVYVVSGEKAKRGRVRGVAGLTAPMVGRKEEMATLQEVFWCAMDEELWHVATIIGEAGIGKTRLKREFVGWAMNARPEVRLLSARSYTHTQTTPYYLISRLVRSLFDLGEEVDQATTDRLGEALHALAPDLDDTEYHYQHGSLANVLGLSLDDNPLDGLDPEQRRDRTFLSLERILLRVSERLSYLIVIDDLHWADAMSLAFLERLLQTIARRSSDGPAMLLMLSRPAESEHAPVASLLTQIWGSPYVTVELDRLDSDQSGALVSALLDQELPAELLHFVIDHAQGNPFFVEEILRSLIEEGVLVEGASQPAARRPTRPRASSTEPGAMQRGAAGWHVTQSVADIAVPGTIQDVLAARLDRLSLRHKQILQYAAVVGRTFWQGLLTEIYNTDTDGPDVPVSNVESMLAHLEQRHFVARLTESQLVDDWEWIFEHVLIQEVAYAGVLKKVRRRVHRVVAARLEAHLNERTGFLIPLIAYHYERGDVPAKAVTYLQQAGDQAAEQYANEEAVYYYTRALTLLEDAGLSEDEALALRYELLLGREAVYGLMGQRDAQAADLDSAESCIKASHDSQRMAKLSLRRTQYYESISAFPRALTSAQQAAAYAKGCHDVPLETEALTAWGNALWRQGKLGEARERLQEALTLARQDGTRRNEATSLHYLGTVMYFLGHYDEARVHLEQALEIRRENGDRKGEATTLSNLIGVYHDLGDLEKAKTSGEQALQIVRSIGSRWSEGYSLMNLGSIFHALGQLDTAHEYFQESIALFSHLGDKSGRAFAALNLGVVLCDLEEYERAKQYCQRALSIEQSIGDRRGEAYSFNHLGLALEGLHEWDEAKSAFEHALRIRREMGQDARAIDDVAGLARVALECGQYEVARTHVEEVLQWIKQCGVDGIEYPIRVYLTSARVLQATGQLERACAVLTEAQALVEQKAALLKDEETRRTFLENLPLHRKLYRKLDELSGSST